MHTYPTLPENHLVTQVGQTGNHWVNLGLHRLKTDNRFDRPTAYTHYHLFSVLLQSIDKQLMHHDIKTLSLNNLRLNQSLITVYTVLWH
jgi:hypothetical protein